LTSYKILITPT